MLDIRVFSLRSCWHDEKYFCYRTNDKCNICSLQIVLSVWHQGIRMLTGMVGFVFHKRNLCFAIFRLTNSLSNSRGAQRSSTMKIPCPTRAFCHVTASNCIFFVSIHMKHTYTYTHFELSSLDFLKGQFFCWSIASSQFNFWDIDLVS